jgi:DNA-binding transcriptional LysR family regulator
MLDWNDLRHFLAVARTGSTLAAGRSLRVSQTTAARRVTALEAALGLILFERRPTGYVLTPAGEELMETACLMESAAGRFADAAAAQNREIGGTVRLTVDEIYAVTILAPILRDLHDTHPAIRIELDTTEEKRDLGAGQADIALRSSKGPTPGWSAGASPTTIGRSIAAAIMPPPMAARAAAGTLPAIPSSAAAARACGRSIAPGSKPTASPMRWRCSMTAPPACSPRSAPASASPCCPAWSPISTPIWSAACPPTPTMSAACGCSPTNGYATRPASARSSISCTNG